MYHFFFLQMYPGISHVQVHHGYMAVEELDTSGRVQDTGGETSQQTRSQT
jgi:hypothetical protein